MSSPALPSRQRPVPEREQLDLFRALPGDMAPRDSQDLMAFPFFSLAKSRRVAPIDFRASGVTIRVEGTQEHGIATIWDADILIWAASQIVEARDAGLRPSRLMQATPYEILRFIGRGTSLRDYQRLKAALDRLQSTTVATSIRETTGRRLHRFSWINEWKELADAKGTPWAGADPAGLVLRGRLDAALVLTIDPAYFRLTGASSDGCTGWCASTAGASRAAGNSISGTCTGNRAAPRASRTSPTTCARWSRGSRCPATSWASSECRTTVPSC
jgi:plasmid replication initiation protein